MIGGNATTNVDTAPFLNNGVAPFVLIDKNGRIYDMQMVKSAGHHPTKDDESSAVSFSVYFSLSSDGSFNEAIKTGKELIMVDVNEELRSITGHKAELPAFGDIA